MNRPINFATAWFVLLMTVPLAVAASDEDVQPSVERSSAPLSVAPLDHIEYPPDRPAWLNGGPDFDGETHTIVVVSGPSESEQESLEDLKLMQRAALATYISHLVDTSAGVDFYSLTDQEIESELVGRRYSGQLTEGDMTKFEHAVELRFDPQRQQAIAAAWKAVEVRDRLGALGVLVFAGFVLLICSSGVVGIFSRRIERRENAAYGRPQNV